MNVIGGVTGNVLHSRNPAASAAVRARSTLASARHHGVHASAQDSQKSAVTWRERRTAHDMTAATAQTFITPPDSTFA
jgi:hypothetical protein